MHAKEATELRETWGSKECDHPDFSREFFMGSHTGDYVCIQCGKEFLWKEMKTIEEQRKK